MNRGQIELNVLTKIAMLFFIISLSFIALNISNYEKSGLCSQQALATAKIIASNINQLLSSQLEDGRVVYKFDPTIQVSSRERFGERYTVWLAKRETSASNSVQFRIVVKPQADDKCTSWTTLFYDKNKVEMQFFADSAPVTPDTSISHGEEVVVLTPSNKNDEERTKYLVIVKCKEKRVGGRSFLYLDDCRNNDANACSPLEPVASHLAQCGE